MFENTIFSEASLTLMSYIAKISSNGIDFWYISMVNK